MARQPDRRRRRGGGLRAGAGRRDLVCVWLLAIIHALADADAAADGTGRTALKNISTGPFPDG